MIFYLAHSLAGYAVALADGLPSHPLGVFAKAKPGLQNCPGTLRQSDKQTPRNCLWFKARFICCRCRRCHIVWSNISHTIQRVKPCQFASVTKLMILPGT